MLFPSLMLATAIMNLLVCLGIELYAYWKKPRHATMHIMAIGLYGVAGFAIGVFLALQGSLQETAVQMVVAGLAVFSLLLYRMLGINTVLGSSLFSFILLFVDGLVRGNLPRVFYFHIAAALMGLIIAFSLGLISILFLWQEDLLKKKKVRLLNKVVPALDVLERVMFASLWVGFAFLTTALISGAFVFGVSEPAFAQARSYLLKIIMACIVWGWFFIILLVNTIFALSAKKMAKYSLWGVALLSLLFLFLQYREVLS